MDSDKLSIVKRAQRACELGQLLTFNVQDSCGPKLGLNVLGARQIYTSLKRLMLSLFACSLRGRDVSCWLKLVL